MRTLLVSAVAVTSLTIGSALAQTTTPAPAPTLPRSDSSTPPATTATPPAATKSPSAASGQVNWYARKNDDMRASKLIGTSVQTTSGENIGEINELVVDHGGKVAAVVVGVGGFLGIGEREVALSYDSLKMNVDSNGRNVITVNTTKDALKAAPQWTWPKT